jgi:hypothetical protein
MDNVMLEWFNITPPHNLWLRKFNTAITAAIMVPTLATD